MAKRRKVGNLLALAILSQLAMGRPMHPYEIATMLKRTGKEHDMNIKWGSFYTVVGNLEKAGYIEATTSDRAGRRPERTMYAITDAGREELRDWVRELVAVPEPEVPRFEAGLSVMSVLPPDEVTALLESRLTALQSEVEAQRSMLADAAKVPRVFLVEAEHALALKVAEVAWVRSLLDELNAGTLGGLDAWRTYHETGGVPKDLAEMLAEGGPLATET
jgi:DNA-binding PadR family transcriptional regulator